MLLDSPAVDFDRKAAPFELADADGARHSLEELQGENGLLVAFICNHCPYVQAVIDRFVADAKALEDIGVSVVAIMSNDYRSVPTDRPEMMKRFAAQHGLTFPYLVDDDQSVGKAYDAVCTPDFLGFNAAGELQYRGRLDDARMGDATNRTPELLRAMKMIAATGRGPDTQHPSMGCSIKWT